MPDSTTAERTGAADLEGAWRIHSYVVAGRSTPVHGVLLLAAGHWSTLYFTTGEAGEWASAEAGRYEADHRHLSFHHRLMFQGGGGQDLRMTQTASHVETCPYQLDQGRLVIHFPSGNQLHLERQGHGSPPLG